jgi:hypothetical protein
VIQSLNCSRVFGRTGKYFGFIGSIDFGVGEASVIIVRKCACMRLVPILGMSVDSSETSP